MDCIVFLSYLVELVSLTSHQMHTLQAMLVRGLMITNHTFVSKTGFWWGRLMQITAHRLGKHSMSKTRLYEWITCCKVRETSASLQVFAIEHPDPSSYCSHRNHGTTERTWYNVSVLVLKSISANSIAWVGYFSSFPMCKTWITVPTLSTSQVCLKVK